MVVKFELDEGDGMKFPAIRKPEGFGYIYKVLCHVLRNDMIIVSLMCTFIIL